MEEKRMLGKEWKDKREDQSKKYLEVWQAFQYIQVNLWPPYRFVLLSSRKYFKKLKNFYKISDYELLSNSQVWLTGSGFVLPYHISHLDLSIPFSRGYGLE